MSVFLIESTRDKESDMRRYSATQNETKSQNYDTSSVEAVRTPIDSKSSKFLDLTAYIRTASEPKPRTSVASERGRAIRRRIPALEAYPKSLLIVVSKRSLLLMDRVQHPVIKTLEH